MSTPRKRKDTPQPLSQTQLEKDYNEIMQQGKEQQPGINELLELYGEFEIGFKQSQEYLQLTEPIVYSSASNTSEAAL